MSIIKCPECHRNISNLSNQCIHCGYPLEKISFLTESSATKQLKKDSPKGIGGWLLFFIIAITVIAPLGNIGSTTSDFILVEAQNPLLSNSEEWITFKKIYWFIVICISIYGIASGIFLAKEKKPTAVENAISYLWVSGPIASFILSIILPITSFDKISLSNTLSTSVTPMLISTISTLIWIAYLKKSKRVKNTYYGDSPEESMHKKETFISIEKQNNADKIERLHNAVWLQDYDMIKNILENGENINKLDNDGRTALDIANICKNNTIKDFLISHGAQENNK